MPLPRRIELEDARPSKIRIALIVLAIAVAAIAFTAGIRGLLGQSSGWQSIDAYPEGIDCSGDFVLQVCLDAGGASDTVSSKKLSGLYTQALEEACAAFYPHGSLAALNESPNETVEVDPALYEALRQIEAAENRCIYLAPVYALYNRVFLAQSEEEAMSFDPERNEELRAYAAEIAAFANDPAAISLQLEGENRARLTVSESYLAFAEENGIETFLDLGWMTNAFMVDYMAEKLIENGCTMGYLASYDGFTRSLGPEETQYSLNLFCREDREIHLPAVMEYTAPMSIVALRDYPMSEADRWHYFSYSDGAVTSVFVDPASGRSAGALNDLVGCAEDRSCAEILLALTPLFLSDAPDTGALEQLAEDGIGSVCFAEQTVHVLGGMHIALTEDGEAAGYDIAES